MSENIALDQVVGSVRQLGSSQISYFNLGGERDIYLKLCLEVSKHFL